MFERLAAELTLNTQGFSSGINDAQNDLDGFADRAADVGSSMQGVGKKMSLGLTTPLAAAGGLALSSAADAEEMRDRSEAVFGDMTDEVETWADQTAEDMGRSRNQLQDMATTMQDMLDPTGESTEEVADLSMGMAELAEDVGSFQNMDSERVMDKFMSAMAGQSKAVRDLGVDMSNAAVEQELLNQGVEGGTEAATDAEEAQARYNILMRETQAAHGNAADTADTFTGQMRQIRARASDLAAEFGSHLLPAATRIAQSLGGLIDRFQGLSHRQQQVIVAVAALAASLGPLLLGLGTLLTLIPAMQAGWAAFAAFQLSTAIPAAAATVAAYAPLIATVLAVAAVAAALFYAWDNNIGGIQDITQEAALMAVQAFESLRSGAERAFNAIMETVRPVMEWFGQLYQQYFAPLEEDVRMTLQVWQTQFRRLVEWLRPYLNQFLEWFQSTIGTALDWVSQKWDEHGGKVMAIVGPLSDGIRAIVETLAANFTELISGMLSLARGDFEGFKDSVKSIVENTVDLIIAPFEWLYNKLIGNSIIPDMLSDILAAVSDWDIAGAFSDALSGALDTVTGLASDFRTAGSELAGNVADGIKDGMSNVGDAASELAGEARDKLPFSPAKEGPLSDLDEVGPGFTSTIADGIESNSDDVEDATLGMAGKAKPRQSTGTRATGGSFGDVNITINRLIASNPEEAADELHRELRAKNLTR